MHRKVFPLIPDRDERKPTKSLITLLIFFFVYIFFMKVYTLTPRDSYKLRTSLGTFETFKKMDIFWLETYPVHEYTFTSGVV